MVTILAIGSSVIILTVAMHETKPKGKRKA
jgi:hypothetical protein